MLFDTLFPVPGTEPAHSTFETQQFVEGQTDERLRAAKSSAVRLKALAHIFFVLPVHTRAARCRCDPKLLEEKTALEK